MLRKIALISAALAVSGVAIAAPAPRDRSGPGTLNRAPAPRDRSSSGTQNRAPAPRQRGGSGSLGGFMERSPTRDRFRRSDRYYRDRFYRDRFYDPFFYSPFFYDPFYRDPWGRYSVPGYRSQGDWSDRGNIQLNVEPRDVEVIVDGIPTAKGGRAFLNLPAGPHHIEIIRPGYRPWVLDLDVKQGVRYRLEQRLERLSKEEQERGEDRPIANRFGELRLTVRPEDAIVHLDGRLLGMASLLRGSEALQRLPLGRHTLRFTRPGYETVEREITVTANRPVEVSVELERE